MLISVFIWILGLVIEREIIPGTYILLTVLISFAVILILNRDLYLFFYRKRGGVFAFLSLLMHMLFYIYSGATLSVLWVNSKIKFW